MKTLKLTGSAEPVSAVISGQMRIAEKSDAQIRQLYDAARRADINFFDHADLYGFNAPAAQGAYHFCEDRFARALALGSAEREQIVLQTKTSIVIAENTYYDASYEHIVGSAERSLAALRTDYLDILLLHRPDVLLEPEEVARAFSDLEAAGKVRAFGVSNYTPGQIELLKTAVEQPLVANQLQFSLPHASLVAQGLTANIQGEPDSSVLDGGGLLDYCRRNKMALQAWSPFQVGYEPGRYLGSEKFAELNKLIGQLADKYKVSAEALVLAWILRMPGTQVVAGTTSPSRLAESAQGADIELTRAEWYGLYAAAGHRLP